MPSNPKDMQERITRILSAMRTLRPEKTFASMNLAQLEEKTAPSLAARALIARLENELIAAQNQRDDADAASLEAIQLVVNAVKGDPDEGEDGELYEAMGYVRKSERKSGLSRKGKATTTTTKA